MKIARLPNDDRSCGWYDILPPPPPARRLTGSRSFEYLVLGAGYTGLAAARRLANHLPDTEIALVDAQRVGAGASGRNSGFIIDLPHYFADSRPGDDPEADRREMRRNAFAMDTLREIVQGQGIECQWSARGKFHAAVEDKGIADLNAFKRSLDRLGAKYQELDAAALEARLGTGYYREGIHTPGCVLVQPAALTRGLGASLPENVSLFEETPVTSIAYGQPHELDCPEGQIRVTTLLLAINGFATQFGFARNRLIPVMTFGSLTRPLTEAEQGALGGEFDWGIIPADHLGTTLRYTQDKRLLIRNTWTYAPRFSCSPAGLAAIRKQHVAAFAARFPMLPGVTLEHSWGGVLALSRNGGPCFGRLGERVYAALCHNGVGITRGTYGGALLADLVVGAESELLSDICALPGPARNPPQPFLGLGVRAKIAWEQHKAGRER